jgi:class 3 adenylate cyclase
MGEMAVGTVTFLFTDIEGSTLLWQDDEATMGRAVARHDLLLRAVVAGHGGVVFSTMGDGLAAAFQTASAAVSCSVEAQGVLDRESGGRCGRSQCGWGCTPARRSWARGIISGRRLPGRPG